ncbi:hypothetical protein HMPREF1640_02315 [Prevotella sp. S7-1-8]|nr:hypothetical protein HMPREF1640_02315 [Prevotella sp. S7-1-8]
MHGNIVGRPRRYYGCFLDTNQLFVFVHSVFFACLAHIDAIMVGKFQRRYGQGKRAPYSPVYILNGIVGAYLVAFYYLCDNKIVYPCEYS